MKPRQSGQLLIIDPAMKRPTVEAYNCVSGIVGALSHHPSFNLRTIRYVTPYLHDTRLRDIFHNTEPGAIISLGSVANMTERMPWVEHLKTDLQPWLDHGVPFLGICFSHQMIADLFEQPVGFLRNRHSIRYSRYHEYRRCFSTHPKFGLLLADFPTDELYSGNRHDLLYQEAILETRNWSERQWKLIQGDDESKLTNKERRVKLFLEKYCKKEFISHARHEQEVLAIKKGALLVGAESPQCEVEALFHSELPLYSVQTHPETPHTSGDGELLIRNFIFMANVLNGAALLSPSDIGSNVV